MGRNWESADGNLFASTILRIAPGDPSPASLTFVTSLAAYETARQIAPEVPMMIKWPNDLLTADGAKICGILLERSGDAVIIGVGMNLFAHPDGLERAVSDLRSRGADPPHAQAVVEILGETLKSWLQRWRLAGLAPILKSWQLYAHPLGTPLSVNLPTGEVQQGIYDGLNRDGSLRLRLADGEIHAIHAADIFLI
jgi:BirA family transcriptional regulator, biotin operon repressor / biotin---[acetyl-CoA-carboxylase] ligase